MLPLEGIKVLDLGRTLPGPYCAMMLADMGADVIRIEEPNRPLAPYLAPHYLEKIDADKREEVLMVYNFVNRNKKSICMNLKVKQAQGVFHRLAERSDVVIEDLRPGVTKRLNVDYETLKVMNPRIVYCAITGFGQDGPYRDRPGHDPNYMGVAGVLGITGTAEGHHAIPGIPFSDLAAGMQGANGILCALIARSRTGKGQFIDVSMTDCVASLMAIRHGQLYFSTGKAPKLGERIPHVYETMDGKYVCFAPAEPHFWEQFCRALGLERHIPYREHALISDPSDSEKGLEIAADMAKAFRTKARKEWLDLLADSGLSPVYSSIDEVFADPQLVYRKILVDIDHPKLGTVKQLGIPVRLSDNPGEIRMLPRKAGQDTEEILAEIGCTEMEIEALRKSEAVR